MPEWLTNLSSGSMWISKTFTQQTLPNLGHSLMTKCLYGLILFYFFTVSNWTPSFRVKEFSPSLQKPQAMES